MVVAPTITEPASEMNRRVRQNASDSSAGDIPASSAILAYSLVAQIVASEAVEGDHRDM